MNSQIDEASKQPRRNVETRMPWFGTNLRGLEPMGLVCAALSLAWIALVFRIASVW